MEFFSLNNRTLVIVLGLALIASWLFSAYQYGVNHEWAALDFARTSAHEYNDAECIRWFNTGQANLTSFMRLGVCSTQNSETWTPACKEAFRGFYENMERWFEYCGSSAERQL